MNLLFLSPASRQQTCRKQRITGNNASLAKQCEHSRAPLREQEQQTCRKQHITYETV